MDRQTEEKPIIRKYRVWFYFNSAFGERNRISLNSAHDLVKVHPYSTDGIIIDAYTAADAIIQAEVEATRYCLSDGRFRPEGFVVFKITPEPTETP